MFTHMVPVKKVVHNARNCEYEILVYKIEESDEYRIYVAKGGFGVGDIFTASYDDVHGAKSDTGIDIIEDLISTAVDDINRNEFGLY